MYRRNNQHFHQFVIYCSELYCSIQLNKCVFFIDKYSSQFACVVETKAEMASKRSKRSRGLWEKRIMYLSFIAGLLATFILLVAVSTDYWVTVTLARSQYRNDTDRDGEFYKTGHYHGLWRICRQEYVNTSADTDTSQHAIR